MYLFRDSLSLVPHVCVLQNGCGDQSTTCRESVSPSTIWVLGSNSVWQTWPPKALYLLSYFDISLGKVFIVCVLITCVRLTLQRGDIIVFIFKNNINRWAHLIHKCFSLLTTQCNSFTLTSQILSWIALI